MRRRCTLLGIPLLIASLRVGLGPGSVEAQWSDRKAVEAAVEALAPRIRPLYVAPRLVQSGMAGLASLNAEHLQRLRARYGAVIEDPDRVIQCEDPTLPESCRIPAGGILLQFLAPEPIREGVLTLAVNVARDETGEGVAFETWRLELTQRPGLGWEVVSKERQEPPPSAAPPGTPGPGSPRPG